MITQPFPRLGCTIPFDSLPLREHAAVLRRAEAIGYTDAWTAEVDGIDAFTPLTLAATATDTLRLGTAIVSVFTRGPALLAMSAAGMAEMAPGRFCLGMGTSSNVIVERWNSESFDRPLDRLRDVTAVVRAVLRGERVEADLETIQVHGFRLSRPVPSPVPIFLAALRPRALRQAGALADGVLLTWLGAEDVPKAIREIRRGQEETGNGPVEIACRLYVTLGDREAAERQARREIAAYLTVPVYERFHRWLGHGESLDPMLQYWRAGSRREATAVIPEELVRSLVLYGDRDERMTAVDRYRAAGVDTVILHFIPTAQEPIERARQVEAALWEMAPEL